MDTKLLERAATKVTNMSVSRNEINGELVVIAMNAIRRPENWERVLDLIIAQTPATAAIITLRDKTTCQIVNDDQLESEYFSPLIRGFSLESVMYYLTQLRTIDPWAEAQRTHYPFRPTAMSHVRAPEDFADQRFFDWLRSENKEDTVVFELDRMPGYWTACNFFLPTRDSDAVASLLQFSDTHFELLREAWQSGRELVKQQQANQVTLKQFDTFGIAAGIAGANGELQQANDRFEEMIAKDAVRASGPERRLSFAKGLQVEGLVSWEDIALSWHEEGPESYRVNATPIEPDPLYRGKREKIWLLTIAKQDDQRWLIQISPIGLSKLTKQETAILTGVRNGQSVVDAGKLAGVRRTRAFDIWASAKRKLGINNAHQVR